MPVKHITKFVKNKHKNKVVIGLLKNKITILKQQLMIQAKIQDCIQRKYCRKKKKIS